jgi:hypothetical protein
MTEQQCQQRAAFIREQPGLWLFLMYAGAFVGCAVATDVLWLAGDASPSHMARYLLPLAIALPVWVGLRCWARRWRQSGT